jgi:hypothetical protein
MGPFHSGALRFLAREKVRVEMGREGRKLFWGKGCL